MCLKRPSAGYAILYRAGCCTYASASCYMFKGFIMAITFPPARRRASLLVRTYLRAMVALYRRTDGSIGGRLGAIPVLLLTTTGRTSGQPHTIPLAYFEDEDNLFV